jgi:nucleoside-diphosphate-sugar epimerase
MTNETSTVLVTGATGHVGSHSVERLLAEGYRVRVAVRQDDQEQDVRAGAGPSDRLEFVTATLTADDNWDKAVAGVRYVWHHASPFPFTPPRDADEVIVPARDGALRVLRAALDAGAERIVLTSSVAAVRNGGPPANGSDYTEEDWTDGDNTSLTPYTRSKTIAERAAWGLVKEKGAEERLAVINPGAIIGPVLSDDRSFSLELIERLMKGAMPALPRLGFSLVDVRDVAALELLAMTSPEAGGKRFIATDQFLWMGEIADVLRERLGEDASKVPTRTAPNLLIKAVGLFDPSVRSFTDDLGKRTEFSNQRARDLGWTPRPVGDSIAETAQSLKEHGVL